MIPRFVPPQLATLVPHPPTDPGWIFETKYDGYRIECLVRGGTARLLSRRAKDWTAKFAPIASAAADIQVESALLDGEVVALDAKRRMSFRALQQYFEHPVPSRLRYFVFDILHLNGHDTRELPFADRRELLSSICRRIPRSSPIRISGVVSGRGKRVIDRACSRGLEGVIGKRRTATYESGRTHSWIKIKCAKRQEFIVIGFTLPAGARRGFGALVLGVMEDGHLRFAGRVGTGFSDSMLLSLRRTLDALRVKTLPVGGVPAPMARGVHWVRPTLVAEVAFTEWTEDGLLRHPSFQGLREDKAARDVRHEGSDK
jgi:bifunctional non-homologous end joining protein LigD